MGIGNNVSAILSRAIALLTLMIPLCHASPENTIFKVSFLPGITIGEGNSFVYYDGDMISKLDWPLKPLVSSTISARLESVKGLYIDASFMTGLPIPSGTMIDADYLNQPTNSVKTHQSTHEGSIEYAIDTTIHAGRIYHDEEQYEKPYSLEMYAAFRYMRYKWNARDGYTQYPQTGTYGTFPEWSTNTPKVAVTGKILAYEQEMVIPHAGIAFGFSFTPKLMVTGGFGMSPFIYCAAIDNHLHPSKLIDYFDSFPFGKNSGFYLDPSLSASWILSSKCKLRLDADWTMITGLKGTTVQRDNMTGSISSDDSYTAGAAFNSFSLRLGLETKLH